MRWLVTIVVLLSWARAEALSSIDMCLGSTPVCVESADAWVDSSCGQVFYSHVGRVSFPLLQNNGPVTVSILTHRRDVSQPFPVYISIVQVPSGSSDSCSSVVPVGTSTVLVGFGTRQCEGIWETIGPLDLVRHGVPVGSGYRVQALFFATPAHAHAIEARSVSLACVRITQASSTQAVEWGHVKQLYR